jgi:hypothetical protein
MQNKYRKTRGTTRNPNALPQTKRTRGVIMPRPHSDDHTRIANFVLSSPRIRYLVVRQEDVWFIKFDGEEYGPYQSEREAMLFAIDAAYKLGEQGEETQVLQLDENGQVRPAWTYGSDPYPPNL